MNFFFPFWKLMRYEINYGDNQSHTSQSFVHVHAPKSILKKGTLI